MKANLLRINQNSSASTSSKSLTLRSKDGGCPSETVPIKRITKDDLIRHRRMPPPESVTFDTLDTVAIAQTPSNPFIRFGGAGMIASIYNPHVKDQQHSACRLKIETGSDIIQVGWRAGEIHCFNTLCPGFILVNSEIPVDVSYDGHISQRGGKIWEDTMYIERIFTDLAGFATTVSWGGVTYSPQNVAEPPMGSSFFPVRNSRYDAYCKKIATLNVRGQTIAVHKTITHVDNPNMYKVIFKPLRFRSKSSFFVLYGGPGESAQV
ncbi:putative polyadenylate-binding protein, cytoplasmic and nuclear-like [Capsicum annuum]|nr:putative polyadenylate-binding protein, cytoplasmic and nuclear-like [Capsicum annuum]KAF3640980.1 putative polyadenylate-binding protein, cytoplasmic and nuclear-like [Capsicum annuum]